VGARAIARGAPRPLLIGAFTLTALALLWLARAPVPADYATDVLGPLIVLGASLSIAFVVVTHEAVADVHPDDRGMASGHLRDLLTLAAAPPESLSTPPYSPRLPRRPSTPTAIAAHSSPATPLACTGLLDAWMSRTRRPQIR
jgi:hypothetical protein